MSRERFDSFTEVAKYQQPARGLGLSSNGLPRVPSQKSHDGLALRRYASSGSGTAAISPVVPPGFSNPSGNLRVPGGPRPVLPGDQRSPFRFLATEEDPPLTPIDFSPVTPRTPRFAISEHHAVAVVSSSPISPEEPKSIDFHLNGKFSPLEKTSFPPQEYQDGCQPSEIALLQSPRNLLEPISGRSTPYLQSYETPLAEEEYAAFVNAQHSQQRAVSPPLSVKTSSREKVWGRAVNVRTNYKRLSTRSLSPPRHHHASPIERPFATTVVTNPLRHIDPAGHHRQISAGSPVDRSKAHQFAVAKKASSQERPDVTLSKWASYSSQSQARNATPFGSEGSYPLPKPTSPDVLQGHMPTRPRVTPTPNKPALTRLGSKLKSEIKGAFNRMTDIADAESKVKKSSEEKVQWPKKNDIKKVEAVHWTELDY